MHEYTARSQVNTHLQRRTSLLHTGCHAIVSRLTYKWRNYSCIPQCALILIFPACWIYLLNLSLSLCGRQLLWHMMPCSVIEKNEQSLITLDQKIFSSWTRMQCECCNNITDNHYLKVRIYGNNAGMSRSGMIALYFTLQQQCIFFKGITTFFKPPDSDHIMVVQQPSHLMHD